MDKTTASTSKRQFDVMMSKRDDTLDLEMEKKAEVEILREFDPVAERGLETIDEINQEIGDSAEEILNKNFSSQLPGLNPSINKKEEEAEGDESVGMILRGEDLLAESQEKTSRNKIEVIPEVDEEHLPRESLTSDRALSVPADRPLEAPVSSSRPSSSPSRSRPRSRRTGT